MARVPHELLGGREHQVRQRVPLHEVLEALGDDDVALHAARTEDVLSTQVPRSRTKPLMASMPVERHSLQVGGWETRTRLSTTSTAARPKQGQTTK